jgi:hypothetical protein
MPIKEEVKAWDKLARKAKRRKANAFIHHGACMSQSKSRAIMTIQVKGMSCISDVM